MMEKQIQVYCTNTDSYVNIVGGTNLLEVYETLKDQIPFKPICAVVNNKSAALTYPIYSPKTVEFLPVNTPSGNRTYIRSLCMMLYLSVNSLLPGARLRIEHSLSNGYYCTIETGGKKITDSDTIKAIELRMRNLVKRNLPFIRCEERTENVIEFFRKQGLSDKVKLLSTIHELYTVYYNLDGICDSYYGQLAPSTGILNVFELIPYYNGMLLLGPDNADPSRVNRPEPQPKMFQAFTDYEAFNHVVGINNVGELNTMVADGHTDRVINVSEALHNNRIASITDEITRRFRKGEAKVVLIAGPSSSGKTTFTKRLAIQLMTNLIKPQTISLDDYFVDRHLTPKDENGEYDYESLYALDLDKFNTDINALINGEEIELPYYNFTTGMREYRGNKISLESDTILLIEGIHGLNPELTNLISDRMKFRIYVSALTTISIDDHNWIPTTDNRLLRRIIRDARYRGVNPVYTIRRWPSVRRGEEKWIFPYQENADIMFNSSLLFELGVIKDQADKLLRQVPHDVPEYAEASRLRRFINYFESISEESVPSTSLLREFLGGSSFKY